MPTFIRRQASLDLTVMGRCLATPGNWDVMGEGGVPGTGSCVRLRARQA